MAMPSTTDRIERQIQLKASIDRVWRAVSNAEEFGDWFGIGLKGKTFAAGQLTSGNITYPGYEHLTADLWIAAAEPKRLFSFQWHPYAIDPAVDYSKEPKTLVEFTLKECDGGTLLKIVESGFDQIPVHRRAEAFRMNGGGWTEQLVNIEKHVAKP